ncbi:MAG: hypothetical protein QOJ40_711, partial [Verrucomicrobiota bacterium]
PERFGMSQLLDPFTEPQHERIDY